LSKFINRASSDSLECTTITEKSNATNNENSAANSSALSPLTNSGLLENSLERLANPFSGLQTDKCLLKESLFAQLKEHPVSLSHGGLLGLT